MAQASEPEWGEFELDEEHSLFRPPGDDDDSGDGGVVDLTIVLLGNTGAGKSASGNSILGRAAFESRSSFIPVTTGRSAAEGKRFGKRIRVVDTPGILGSEERIKTWCQDVLQSTNSCLFLVVVKIDRFTEEEEKALAAVVQVLGDDGIKNSHLLFTGGDALDISLQDYILQYKRSSLRDVVERFGHRYHLFNNKSEDEEQVRELLQKCEHLWTNELPGFLSEGLTIVLLGTSAVGKSASGNKILGRAAFESRPSLRSVTTEIREQTRRVFGKLITVIDTPGILCPGAEEKIQSLLQRLCCSDPCLFLVVVRVGRFTQENQNAVNAAIKVLGLKLRNSYLLFTGGDSLHNTSLEKFISEDTDGPLSAVVRRFEGRIHLFNNEDRGQEEVRELLLKSARSLSLEDRRIVLIGLSGGGKSSSGNTILGSDLFTVDSGFGPVRAETVAESASVEGRRVTLVDTPGFSSRDTDRRQLFEQFNKMMESSEPGPHVFVFVVRIGRMSREDAFLLKALRATFENVSDCSMVLFTHGDQLRGQSVDHVIHSSSCVSELVSSCGGRYCVFDNTKREHREQVRLFLRAVKDVVEANGGQHRRLCHHHIFHMLPIFLGHLPHHHPRLLCINLYKFLEATRSLSKVYEEPNS